MSAVLAFTEHGLSCTDEVLYDSLNTAGDPLTPGYAAIAGVWRNPEKLLEFPQIPVQTISCETAHHLLQLLKGQRSPREWVSDSRYNGTLYMGRKSSHADTWYVKLQTSNYYMNQTVQNVIATINGYQSPGEVVMVGASRTSFTPQGKPSATERLLGLLQPMTTMVAHRRWLPKRTLRFCLWGGQEFGNTGLHEFFQYHKYSVDDTVAFMDLDKAPSDETEAHLDKSQLSVLSAKCLQEFTEAVVAMRTEVLKESSVDDDTFADDDSGESSGFFVDPVTQAFENAEFAEPSDMERSHMTSYKIPVIQAEIRAMDSPSPVEIFKAAQELSRLQALLMLSLADQTVLRYDDAGTARLLKLDMWKLTQRSKVMDEDLKENLHKEADRLVDFTSIFDHMLDNRLDYSKQSYILYINRVLMQLNRQLTSTRRQASDLLSQLTDSTNSKSDDLELANDLDFSLHENSPEFLQSVSGLLVTIKSTNSMIQNVNLQILHYGNKTDTQLNEMSYGLERGWA